MGKANKSNKKLKKDDQIALNLYISDNDYDIRMNDYTLKKILSATNIEKEKNKKSKELIEEYIKIVREKDNEIEKNKKSKDLIEEYIKIVEEKDNEIEKLKKSNEDLHESIKRIPKFIRKIFIKNDGIKLLNG